jgi:hypothetical protein
MQDMERAIFFGGVSLLSLPDRGLYGLAKGRAQSIDVIACQVGRGAVADRAGSRKNEESERGHAANSPGGTGSISGDAGVGSRGCGKGVLQGCHADGTLQEGFGAGGDRGDGWAGARFGVSLLPVHLGDFSQRGGSLPSVGRS